jgi:hypothetical protein
VVGKDWTYRYWGDPDEPVPWDELDAPNFPQDPDNWDDLPAPSDEVEEGAGGPAPATKSVRPATKMPPSRPSRRGRFTPLSLSEMAELLRRSG